GKTRPRVDMGPKMAYISVGGEIRGRPNLHEAGPMLMVCPQCKGSFDGVLQCPKCGVRLMLATEKAQPVTQAKQGKWHQTPAGRIMAGLVLGLGLSYGLLLFVTRILKMESLAPQASVFVFLGIQAVALAVGG